MKIARLVMCSLGMARSLSSSQQQSQERSMKRVAIIGAGSGGLVASKVLRKTAAEVHLFEQHGNVGGIWRNGGDVVYHGLRCNLPHQIMQFKDFDFDDAETNGRSFVTGRQVGQYLERYAQEVPVGFRQCVQEARRKGNQWELKVREASGEMRHDTFDALIVANGHYEQAAELEIPGAMHWPGQILHSRDYFEAAPFAGHTVICIGARSSGTDIAKELHGVAKQVIVADKACQCQKDVYGDNTLLHAPPITRLEPDGTIVFDDGSTILPNQHNEKALVDIISCIGFEYSFPFFSKEIIATKNRSVKPLYLHMFHLEFADSLFFLGIPHSVVPFPLMQVQALLAAAVICDRIQLPDFDQRLQAVAEYEASLSRPKDAHHLGDKQWKYCLDLLRLAQLSDHELTEWTQFIDVNKQIYNHVSPRRPKIPGTDDIYRRLEYSVDRQLASWKCLNDAEIDAELLNK